MPDFDSNSFKALVLMNNEDKATCEAIFHLLDFARVKAFKVMAGKDNSNFHYVVATPTGTGMLFSCGSFGDVEMYLGNFTLDTHTVSHIVRKLFALNKSFEYLVRFEDKRVKGGSHGFLIKDTLVDPTVMKAFQNAVIELQAKIATV